MPAAISRLAINMVDFGRAAKKLLICFFGNNANVRVDDEDIHGEGKAFLFAILEAIDFTDSCSRKSPKGYKPTASREKKAHLHSIDL